MTDIVKSTGSHNKNILHFETDCPVALVATFVTEQLLRKLQKHQLKAVT